MQGDFGPPGRLLRRFDGVIAFPARFPAHALFLGKPGAAGDQRDLVGDDERGIEADSELPDQVGVLRLVAGESA